MRIFGDPPLPRQWRSWVNKAESDAEVRSNAVMDFARAKAATNTSPKRERVHHQRPQCMHSLALRACISRLKIHNGVGSGGCGIAFNAASPLETTAGSNAAPFVSTSKVPPDREDGPGTRPDPSSSIAVLWPRLSLCKKPSANRSKGFLLAEARPGPQYRKRG